MADAVRASASQILAMVVSILLAIVAAVLIVHFSKAENRNEVRGVVVASKPVLQPGVQVVLRSGGGGGGGGDGEDGSGGGEVLIERRWDVLDLSVEAGQTVDEALPGAGPFEGQFTVMFEPGEGKHRYAQIGCEVQNGSVIVMRGDEVLLSDYAGGEAKLMMTRVPIWLPRRVESIVYAFKSDGAGPVVLRAMWQPEGEAKPRPMR